MLNLCGIVVAILKMATGRNFSMSGINLGHHNLPTYEMALNLCGIVVAILKMATGRNFSMSGHHYLPTYKILMISDNIEFLPPIFYAVFWQPFWKWQTSRKF
jgi:putative Mn2+ efflux pump MntP